MWIQVFFFGGAGKVGPAGNDHQSGHGSQSTSHAAPLKTDGETLTMAWIFGLGAEHGNDQHAAQRFARHFEGRHISDEECLAPVAWTDGRWWCTVHSLALSRSGIHSSDEAHAAARFGVALYESLVDAPAFRWARVAVEPDAATLEDVLEVAVDGSSSDGVVLSNEIAAGVPSQRRRPQRERRGEAPATACVTAASPSV